MSRLSVRRRCPKCNGNLYRDSDFHGYYEQCLQCGYTRDYTVEIGKTLDNALQEAELDTVS